MKTVSGIQERLSVLAKAAWDYLTLAATMGAWGYRTPSPGEIQEALRRLDELAGPVVAHRHERLVSACCAVEIALCCV
jgi:thiamine pyrophosphate-dependent acetolactate synthase large subunit-like protein